jgi:5-methylcytosine-specific restriction endonuclease McrA
MTTKHCPKCGETKDVSEFHKSPRARDGCFYMCKLCMKAYQSQHHKEHRDERVQYHAQYDATHVTERRQYHAQYYNTHRKELQQYQQSHPEMWHAANHRRRAAVGDMSSTTVLEVIKASNGICPYCGKAIPNGKGHIDHKTPISRGGTNDRSNLVYVCATCNLRKHTMTAEEFVVTI